MDTGAEVETGPSCATALAPTDTVLEVDKSYKGGASNGTKACPFVTVTAALVARKSVITKIHVKGGRRIPDGQLDPAALIFTTATRRSRNGKRRVPVIAVV